MVYGSEAMIPMKLEVSTQRKAVFEQEENNQLQAANLDLLEEKREMARLKVEIYQHHMARYFNRKVRVRRFRRGDLMLRLGMATGRVWADLSKPAPEPASQNPTRNPPESVRSVVGLGAGLHPRVHPFMKKATCRSPELAAAVAPDPEGGRSGRQQQQIDDGSSSRSMTPGLVGAAAVDREREEEERRRRRRAAHSREEGGGEGSGAAGREGEGEEVGATGEGEEQGPLIGREKGEGEEKRKGLGADRRRREREARGGKPQA